MQILVRVAIIPVRTWKTEVEKGSVTIVLSYRSVDPKVKVNSVNSGARMLAFAASTSKGKQVKNPVLCMVFGGNTREIKDVVRNSGKSFLFFLTDTMATETVKLEMWRDVGTNGPPIWSIRCVSYDP